MHRQREEQAAGRSCGGIGATRHSNVMQVPLKAIGAGAYRLNWRVLSVDTHRTRGSFSFKVAP